MIRHVENELYHLTIGAAHYITVACDAPIILKTENIVTSDAAALVGLKDYHPIRGQFPTLDSIRYRES